jgi:hypothetical protein
MNTSFARFRDCFGSEPLGLLIQSGISKGQGRLVRYGLEKPRFVVGEESTFAIQKTQRADDLTVNNDRHREHGPEWGAADEGAHLWR